MFRMAAPKVVPLLAVCLAFSAAPLGSALALESAVLSNESLYERVAPAVVGITARRGLTLDGSFFGTGTIVSSKGVIVTSTTVVPKDAWQVKVFLKGGEVLSAKVIASDEKKELTLIRISDAKVRQRAFPHLPLGDSDAAQIGATALTFGNAFQSIENDDQVTVGDGVISGRYLLSGTLSESKYEGRVLETSAPLNSGMDGGPLVDAEGRLLGVLCLNYSTSRWLGTAAPINDLKPTILPAMGVFQEEHEKLRFRCGFDLMEDDGGRVLVSSVHVLGPAREAGLEKGDVLLEAGGEVVTGIGKIRELLTSSSPPLVYNLKITRGDEKKTIELRFWRKL